MELQAVAPHARMGNLHFAAHRWDSSQKPFGRGVLFFHALVRTTINIAENRSDEKGKAARAFLDWVNDERCLAFAMLADAGDENHALVTMVEYEGYPGDTLACDLAGFRNRLVSLFCGTSTSAATCWTTGYTGHMLKLLQVPISIPMPGGVAKILGSTTGIATRVRDACLKRMHNWVCLTIETLKVEFPHMEVLQAFGAFSLEGRAYFQVSSQFNLIIQFQVVAFLSKLGQTRVSKSMHSNLPKFIHCHNF